MWYLAFLWKCAGWVIYISKTVSILRIDIDETEVEKWVIGDDLGNKLVVITHVVTYDCDERESLWLDLTRSVIAWLKRCSAWAFECTCLW